MKFHGECSFPASQSRTMNELWESIRPATVQATITDYAEERIEKFKKRYAKHFEEKKEA